MTALRQTSVQLLKPDLSFDNAVLLANLKKNLAAGATNDAMEAGHALLVTFTELLSTLIGDSLTRRLLSPVWAFSSPISEQETE